MVFVLYAAGSPLIVDYEEAVLSCGADLAAIVENLDGPSLASDQSKLIRKDDLDERTLRTAKFLIPLFTPGHRYSAASEVTAIAKNADVTMSFGTLASDGSRPDARSRIWAPTASSRRSVSLARVA